MKRQTLSKNIIIPSGTVVHEKKRQNSPGYYAVEISIGKAEPAMLIIHEDAIRELNLLKPGIVIF